jgi:predicted ATPase/DNA-binding SARP family transcriptional activator
LISAPRNPTGGIIGVSWLDAAFGETFDGAGAGLSANVVHEVQTWGEPSNQVLLSHGVGPRRICKSHTMSTDAPLRIYLLGQPRVVADGVPVKLPKRAATVPLAAYLLLHRAEPVSRSFLAFTLWADATEETALAELRRYIYLLNKALGPASSGHSWIVAEGESVRWNDAAPFWFDVAEFERLSADTATVFEAIQLYAGDLVEDIYDDWLIAHRERLRSLYFADLGALIAQHRESRQFQRAIAFATQLLGADPWREDVIRQLMACRYESGDAAGALAVCDEFVKRLRRELAVEPMPDTMAVRDAIVRHVALPGPAALRTADEVEESALEPASRYILPFVGRKLELDQLQTAWSRAARTIGGLVLIGGEAGIGKSRLAAELARIVESEGGRTLVGSTTCPEREPYECIVEAIRAGLPLIASLEVDPLKLAIVAQLVPELYARRQGLPELPLVDPQRERSRLLDAVASCLAALARVRPMLVVFEDLHWAGAATIAALGFFARRLARAQVLIVATYREEETRRTHPLRDLHRELRGERLVTTLSLRRLPRAVVDELMEHLRIPTGDTSGFAHAMFARTEGNPLFLTEAIRDALDHPDVWREQDAAWAGTERLRALIAARRAKLSQDGQEIAEAAAVIGNGFSVATVRDVTGFTEERVLDGIDDLLDRHFIREAGGRGRFDYVFSHHLIHDAMYEAVTPELRSRRHRRVARILEDHTKSDDAALAADLALHYERGQDNARAASWYLVAAQAAERVYAHVEAIKFATRAIDLTIDERQRAAALCARESALSKTGDRSDQRRDIDEAMEIADRIGDDDLIWRLLMRRMHLERSLGKRDEEGAVIAQLERRAELSREPRRTAEALLARANHLVSLTSHSQAGAPAREALRHYESLEDMAGQIGALSVLAEIATNTGDLDASRRLLDDVRTKAASQPDSGLLLRAISAASVAALQQHRIGDAADLAAEGLTLARSLGDCEEEATMVQRQAITATWQGDFDLARRRFATAAAAFDAIGHLRGMSNARANQAVLALRLGLLDEAQTLGDQALDVAERTGDRRPLAVTFVNLSLVRILRGDPVGAKHFALAGLEVARAVGFPLFEGAALANLGNAERALGNLDVGLLHIKDGLRIRERLLSPTDVLDDYCDLAVGYLQARDLARALSTTTKLLTIAEESLEGAFWPHVCFWSAALVHRVAGKTDATALLERANAEMHAFAAAIADLQTRSAFLALPACREIVAAFERDEWPEYARGAPGLYASKRAPTASPAVSRARSEKRVEKRRPTR